jgi:hypothetical protein
MQLRLFHYLPRSAAEDRGLMLDSEKVLMDKTIALTLRVR